MNLMVYLGRRTIILYLCLLRSCQEYGQYTGSSFGVMAQDEDEFEPEPEVTVGNDLDHCESALKDVCASLLKVGKNEVIKEGFSDDGNLCMCDGCTSEWDEEDGRSLTWYHYEKDDMIVQYRFCEKIVPERECTDKDPVAAVLVVSTEKWNPSVEEFHCRCPSNRYHLQGWMAAKIMGENYWRYTYVCDMDPCGKGGECVRKYLDSSGSHTTGFQFPCRCPKDHDCPLVKAAPVAHNINGQDESGPYIRGTCDEPGFR